MGQTSLSELPLEILEHTLSFLSPADILKMKEVSNPFLDVVSGSQYLQHRIDLFGAGLVDNPNAACCLSERRARLRNYVDGWNNPETPAQYVYPLKNPLSASCPHYVSQDLFSARADPRSRIIHFTRIPTFPNLGEVKEWNLEFPFHPCHHLVYPQDDLLVIIERGIGFMNVHLFDLLDGSPHKVPFTKVLSLNTGSSHSPGVIATQISDSRIALVVQSADFTEAESCVKVIVWDWKTGEVVFELSSSDPGIGRELSTISAVHFLEGSLLVALPHRSSNHRLLVFDTLSPRRGLLSWRNLLLPPGLTRHYSIVLQYESTPTECPEFMVDPVQRKFVVHSHPGSALVIPVELFIQVMHSARADPYMQWDDWGRDVIIVDLHPDSLTLQLADTKLLTLLGSRSRPDLGIRSVEVYDLSKFGQKNIRIKPVYEEEEDGRRRVLSIPTWFNHPQVEDATPSDTFLIGRKVVYFYSGWSLSGQDYICVSKIA